MRLVVVKIIIIGIVIAVGAIGAAFYILKSQKPISPVSSKPQSNETVLVFERMPSKTLKVYTDDSGFSFKYPEDVLVTKKESDSTTYANLELSFNQTKGNMFIKIVDTKLKSIDDWFKENKLAPEMTNKKEIKIGGILGRETQIKEKLLAVALDKGILFTIAVNYDDQKKYWQTVYDTILLSFNFVSQQSKIETETIPMEDSSGSDVILEEETIE